MMELQRATRNGRQDKENKDLCVDDSIDFTFKKLFNRMYVNFQNIVCIVDYS